MVVDNATHPAPKISPGAKRRTIPVVKLVLEDAADSPGMSDLLRSPLTWIAAAVFVSRRIVYLLREILQLRNEWYRRER